MARGLCLMAEEFFETGRWSELSLGEGPLITEQTLKNEPRQWRMAGRGEFKSVSDHGTTRCSSRSSPNKGHMHAELHTGLLFTKLQIHFILHSYKTGLEIKNKAAKYNRRLQQCRTRDVFIGWDGGVQHYMHISTSVVYSLVIQGRSPLTIYLGLILNTVNC